MEIIKLQVAKLAELIKPFSFNPPDWGKEVITKADIDAALFGVDLLEPGQRIRSRKNHIRRIAWLAAYGFGSAIKLNIEPVMVEEGHHRLRAAVHRGDEFISVSFPDKVAAVAFKKVVK